MTTGILYRIPFLPVKRSGKQEQEIDDELNRVYPDHPVYSEDTFLDDPVDRHVCLDIILPVMNPQPEYLDECVHSLLEQKTEYSYRIICIDDGTTDPQVLKMLKQYADSYSDYFILVHQANRGVGAARNRGIRLSCCDYIGFVDQDDRVDQKYVQLLLNEAYANEADAVKCAHQVFQNGTSIQSFDMKDIHYSDGPGEDILSFSGMIWGGIYRRSVFDQIRFPENYWFEDMIARILLYPSCPSFSCISGCLYFKRRHSSNASRVIWKSGEVKSLDHIYLLNHLIEERNRIGLENDRVFFRCLLPEIGQYLMWRSRSLPSKIQRLLFEKACYMFSRYRLPGDYTQQEEAVISAFAERNYMKWKLCAWHEWAGSR